MLFPLKLTKKKEGGWKKEPACKGDWRLYKGDVDMDANYGIHIPFGVVIIDIDVKDGRTVSDKLSEIEKQWSITPDWDSALLQQTVSGGAHFGFNVDWAPRQMQSPLYDTRTTEGFIASGEGYSDETLDGIITVLRERDLPSLPEIAELIEIIQQDDDDFTAWEKSDVDIEDVKYYLAKLDEQDPTAVQEEGTWSRVGQILSFEGANEFRGLFHEWSKQCADKYDADDINKRWDKWGQSRKKPVRFGSLVHMAGGPGDLTLDKLVAQIKTADLKNLSGLLESVPSSLDEYQKAVLYREIKDVYKRSSVKAPTDANVAKLIRKAKDETTGEWLDEYVMFKDGEYTNVKTMTSYKKPAFDAKHDREVPPDNDGNSQLASTYARGNIRVVDKLVYEPTIENLLFTQDGQLCLNSYRDGGCESDGANGEGWTRFKGHLEHLFDEKESELLLYFLATTIQKPGKILGWAPVLKGCQGDGKSYFGVVMQYCLGLRNTRQLDPRQLKTDFTGWAEGQVISFIEEIRVSDGRYDTLNAFKPYITNKVVSVNRKGVDIYDAPNRTNYVMMTNYEDALPIDNSDRRYSVFKTKWQDREDLVTWMNENPDYYISLYESLEDDAESIRWELENLDIPDWFIRLKVAPETQGTLDMIEASKSYEQEVVEAFIDEYDIDGVINMKLLEHFCNEENEQLPERQQRKYLMRKVGFQHRVRMKVDGEMNTFYCRKKLTTAELRKLI